MSYWVDEITRNIAEHENIPDLLYIVVHEFTCLFRHGFNDWIFLESFSASTHLSFLLP